MILYFILSVLFLAVIAPLLHRLIRNYTGWLLAILPALLSLSLVRTIPDIMRGNTYRLVYPWIPSLNISFSFYIDGLSLLFLLLISGIGTFVLIFAGGYLKGHPLLGRFYSYLLLFMAAMWGLVSADNLILMFIFWELTSISSYLLIGFNHEQENSQQAALQALLVTGGGGLALLAGIILIGMVSGTYDISALLTDPGQIIADGNYLPILLLILLGAFTKSAQVPFHFWLPSAMAAPTPVSAFLHSATMVKAGIYLLARLSPVLGGTPEWHYIISLIGVLTMLTGALMAIAQTDLKRLLAYSTVSALGTIVLLIGVNTVMATKAAIVFLIVHSLYKGGLFMVAGAIDHETGTRDVTWLGGLIRVMPVTAIAAGLAALSMSGFPPLLGFVGKELIYEAKMQLPTLSILITITGVLANIVNVAVAIIVGIAPFWDEHKVSAENAHEGSPALWLGPLILSLAGLVAGLYSELLGEWLIGPAVSAVRAELTAIQLILWHGISPVFILSVFTVLFGIGLFFIRHSVRNLGARLTVFAGIGPAEWYHAGLNMTVKFADKFTRFLQNGKQRSYILTILAVTIILLAISLMNNLDFLRSIHLTDVLYFEWIIAAIMVAAGIAVIKSRSRLGGVAAMGVIGYCIALLFVIYGAPDLAITQILVETLTVVLFVFTIYKLPQFANLSSKKIRIRDAIIALIFGGIMTLLVLKTLTIDQPSLSDFFGQNSYLKAFGKNVVNVILVDFRALDTLGEITVLSTAALGVYALLKLKSRSQGEK
jgi:multicomponent Na+:H+ antiporter subunit A